MLPGGGQYDVLAVSVVDGATVMLNRHGTIQVHPGDGDPLPDSTPWLDYLCADPVTFLVRLEHSAGLVAPASVPPSTGAVLVHRLVSVIASMHVLAEPVEVEMGYLDTSGYGGGEADWLAGSATDTTRATASAGTRAVRRMPDVVRNVDTAASALPVRRVPGPFARVDGPTLRGGHGLHPLYTRLRPVGSAEIPSI
jgi:hypothetical protein